MLQEKNRTNSVSKDEELDLEILLRRPSLRRNLRKPSSTVYYEMELTEDTTCGIGCIKGKWLQSFANKNVFVFIYGLLGCMYAAFFAHFNGILTTLEKRFKIPSRTIGLIATGNDIAQIFVCPVLSYYSGKGHRPRWIAIGMYVSSFATFLCALPHIMYGGGEEVLEYTVEHGGGQVFDNATSDIFISQSRRQLCKDEPSKCTSDEEEGITPSVLLFTAQFIYGLGGSLYFSVGTAYVDDNVQKSKSPTLMSLTIILRMLGPTFGYWLASVCLKVFVSPSLTPTITSLDARWIGAWWLGHLVLGVLLFLSAVLLMLFPKQLPKAALRQQISKNKKKENKATLDDMVQTFKRLLRNATYNLNNLSGVFYLFGFMAYWIFLPKYIETQYNQTASTANFMAGTVTLIFSSLGILVSGLILTRFKPRARYLAAWNVFVGVVSFLCAIGYVYIGCDENDQRSEQIYSSQGSLFNDGCNSACHCNYTHYSPVCTELKDTFISPCHAGCRNVTTYNGTKIYTDCECVLLTTNATTTFGRAFDGACPLDCQYKFYLFIALVCFVNFINSTGRTTSFMIQLRCVEEQDKSTSLGFGITVLSLFAFVPSPIIFGYVLDTTCAVWGSTCDGKGNCWLYDGEKLRYVMNYVCAAFMAVGSLFDMGIWYTVKGLKIFDDEEEDKNKKKELTSS